MSVNLRLGHMSGAHLILMGGYAVKVGFLCGGFCLKIVAHDAKPKINQPIPEGLSQCAALTIRWDCALNEGEEC